MATYCELMTKQVPETITEESIVSVDRTGDGAVFVTLNRTHPGGLTVFALSPETAIALASALLNAAQGHHWCAS